MKPEKITELIIYHIQKNESIHLSDKSLHDIHANVNRINMSLREELEEFKRFDHAYRWDGLRNYLVTVKPTGYADMVRLMCRFDSREL